MNKFASQRTKAKKGGVIKKLLGWLEKISSDNSINTHLPSNLNPPGCTITKTSTGYSMSFDSGATTTFFTTKHTGILKCYIHIDVTLETVTPVTNGVKVMYTESTAAQPTHEAYIKGTPLPLAGKTIYLFKYIASELLLSLGQLCNTGFKVQFYCQYCYIC